MLKLNPFTTASYKMASDVCRYYLQGRCYYGDRCKFYHPKDPRGEIRQYHNYGQAQSSYGGSRAHRGTFANESRGRGGYNESSYHKSNGQYRSDVCTYFLKGNCKFGDRCHNEHPRGRTGTDHNSGNEHPRGRTGTDHNYGRRHQPSPASFTGRGSTYLGFEGSSRGWLDHTDSGRQDSMPASLGVDKGASFLADGEEHVRQDPIQQPPVQYKATSLSDLVETIRADMRESRTTHMWPLSCYGVCVTCVPQLRDISPDELRWEAYHARHLGRPEVYIQAEAALTEAQRSVQSHWEAITSGEAALLMGATAENLSNTPAAAPAFWNSGLKLGSSQVAVSTPSNPFHAAFKAQSLATAGHQSTGSEMLATQPVEHIAVEYNSVVNVPPFSDGEGCTMDELTIYRQDRFVLGQIPENAPPQSLC